MFKKTSIKPDLPAAGSHPWSPPAQWSTQTWELTWPGRWSFSPESNRFLCRVSKESFLSCFYKSIKTEAFIHSAAIRVTHNSVWYHHHYVVFTFLIEIGLVFWGLYSIVGPLILDRDLIWNKAANKREMHVQGIRGKLCFAQSTNVYIPRRQEISKDDTLSVDVVCWVSVLPQKEVKLRKTLVISVKHFGADSIFRL